MNLKKPPAYNYDLVVVALSMLITGSLDFPSPWAYSSDPYPSCLYQDQIQTLITNGISHTNPFIVGVLEQRVSNFIMSFSTVSICNNPSFIKIDWEFLKPFCRNIYL
jgi:hypothetical protein